jgi:hypothetical protein
MTATIVPQEYAEHPYTNLLVQASQTQHRNRLLVGICVTGLVRIEWMLARYGQWIPTNWSYAEHLEALSGTYPLGYDVKDARNVIVQQAVQQGYEWLLFVDHDVILPPDCFSKMNAYMNDGTLPVVAGLYTTKSHPPEPLAYRGRGNSYFGDFKVGDTIWVDGCGMGCTMLSVKLLKAMWEDAPEYVAGGNRTVRQVFDTPSFTWIDPEIGIQNLSGTEDLAFFDRMMQGGYLAKAGFKKVAKKRFPIFLDASIICRHVTPDGIQYPLEWRW